MKALENQSFNTMHPFHAHLRSFKWVSGPVSQNGSTAKDVAYQQGYQAVAELLEEYERRLVARSMENLTEDQDGQGLSEDSKEADSAEAVNGSLSKVKTCPKNPTYQDVIPSPKHSPLKTKPNNAIESIPDKSSL